MPEEGIILYLRPLRPARFLLARRSFHKFYFQLEERFARISYQVSILDPWLKSEQIQSLLTYLLLKANKFILTIDEWTEEKLLEKWMKKDADRIWESVVRYVSLRLRMQNGISRLISALCINCLISIPRTMHKLSDLYSGIFQTQSSGCASGVDLFRNFTKLKILNI